MRAPCFKRPSLQIRPLCRPLPQVILPPLPRAARLIVEEHEAGVLQLLVRAHAATAVAAKQPLPAATAVGSGSHTLPLSGLAFPAAARPAPGAAGREAPAGAGSVFGGLLVGWRVAAAACGPFAALSGRGDVFGSAEELLGCVPEGAALPKGGLSLLEAMAGGHGELNA